MSPILGIYASQISGHLFAPSGAYDSIATLSGNGSASQLTFSSIPSTYTHLQVRLIARGTRSFPSEQLYIRLNGDGGNNYAYHYLYGEYGASVAVGAQASTNTFLVNEFPAANETANIYSTSVIDLLDYTNSSKNKTFRSLSGYDNNGNTSNYIGKVWVGSGLWMNTSAVTSLTVLSNGAFASGTRIGLYGIKGK